MTAAVVSLFYRSQKFIVVAAARKKRKRNVTHAIKSGATHVAGPLYHLIWVEIEVSTSLVTERQSLLQPVVPDRGEGVSERNCLLQTLRCVIQACTSCVYFVGLWGFF